MPSENFFAEQSGTPPPPPTPAEAEAIRPADALPGTRGSHDPQDQEAFQTGIPRAIPLEPLALEPLVVKQPPPHPGFWWAVLWCVAFLIVTQVIPVLLVSGIVLLPEMVRAFRQPGAEPKLTQSELASQVMDKVLTPSIALAQVAVITFSWLVIRLVVGRDWTRQLAVRRPSLLHVGLVVFGFPALVILSNGAYELAKLVLPSLEDIVRWFFPNLKDLRLSDMEAMVKVFKQWPWPYGVLIIGLGPGLGEELWCRGFLGRGLVGRYGLIGGVLLTSLFFGLLHVEPRQAAAVALMAIALHLAYLATRSFWVPVLLHTLNNSLAVTSSQIPGLADLEKAVEQPPWWLYLTAALLLAAVGWALYRGRARLRSTIEGMPPWQPDYPGVAYPPPGSGTIVVRPWPGWWAVALVAGALVIFIGSLAGPLAG